MKTLRIGSSGAVVRCLQTWLTQFFPCVADGKYGPATAKIVKKVQKQFHLKADGVVGPATAGRFMTEGWLPPSFEQPTDEASSYPACPADYAPLNTQQKIGKFGRPGRAPEKAQPGGAIQRDPAFSKRIVRLDLTDWFPHIEGVQRLDLHEDVQRQWRALFDAIATKDLGDRLLSCAGGWNPRFVRGSVTAFSSHAFATAIDFNAPQNWLAAQPAKKGREGSLVELVPLAKRYKIWWGGWFRRVDGMHFESTLTDSELGLG